MAEWVPLTETTDYTLSSTEITLSGVTPDADSAYDVHYSYADASADGGHQHTVEQRDGSWNGGQTWSLAHRPDGHEFLLMGSAAPIPLYVVYDGSDTPSTHNAKVRRMGINRTDGTFVSWETAAIDGFVGEGGTTETVDALAYHHTDRNTCYIGTHDGTNCRIYKCDGETLTVVHTLAFGGSVGQIAMHTDGRVAWCLAGLGASPTTNNVYVSDTAGGSWAGVGAGFGGTWVGGAGTGINAVTWVGDNLATLHNRLSGGTTVISTSVGSVWTGISGTCRDAFSYNASDIGSIGYAADIAAICWSYWHFVQFLGTPSYAASAVSGGATLTLSTTTVSTGVWPNGDGLGVVPGAGEWLTGAFGGSGWTSRGSSLDPVLRRGFNLYTQDAARRWAAHAPYTSNHLNISIDAGVSWAAIASVPFCRMAAFMGGSN